jgi:hypothetical protein
MNKFTALKNKFETENKKIEFNFSEFKKNLTPDELKNCYGALQNILCGFAKLDEENVINTISWEKLAIEDIQNILEQYIVNFIPSTDSKKQ